MRYPIFLNLEKKRVVLIGGGCVALRKAEALLETGAVLVVVSPEIHQTLESLCNDRHIEMIRDRYHSQYIERARLVIAATNDMDLNQRIYNDCRQLEILCNVVDKPDLCDFFVPAVIRRGRLQIAISTEGNCPAYAGHLRRTLERIITEQHGRFLDALEILRQDILRQCDDPDQRKALLVRAVSDASFEIFLEQGQELWLRQYAGGR